MILPTLNLKLEKWKFNKEFQVYVSTLGNFRNIRKELIPLMISNNGYVMIETSCGLKPAHRLVMLTWKPICNAEDLTVDHKNHNKRENTLNNLEWVTKQENQRRAARDYLDNISVDESVIIHRESLYCQYKNLDSAVSRISNLLMKKQKDVKREILNAIKTGKSAYGTFWFLKEGE